MEDDVYRLVERGLRESDVTELMRMKGWDSYQGLMESYEYTRPICFTILAGDTPCAMFGVGVTETPGVGTVWLLGTDDIHTIRRQFVRRSVEWVKWMNTVYHTLTNYVDAENTLSHEWLEACGFAIAYEDVLFNDFPFYLFWRNHA